MNVRQLPGGRRRQPKLDAPRLAAFIARKLFENGDEPERPCKRIQSMTGEWPEERAAGGYVESTLTRFIACILVEYEEGNHEEKHEN